MNEEFNTQICTTIEQSKRLLRLGIDPKTADCTYWKPNEFEDYMLFPYGLENKEEDEVSAWSLHRLIVMLPTIIYTRTFSMPMNYPETKIIDYENNSVAYLNMFGSGEMFNKNKGKYALYDNLIACIEWLIKYGFFNKKYLLKEE